MWIDNLFSNTEHQTDSGQYRVEGRIIKNCTFFKVYLKKEMIKVRLPLKKKKFLNKVFIKKIDSFV